MLILFILFVIASIYGIIQNIYMSTIYTRVPEESELNKLSNLLYFGDLETKEVNKEAQEIYYINSWLHFCAILIIILFLQIIRFHQRMISAKRIYHPGNYAVMIKNLPKDDFDKKEFIFYISNLWKESETEDLDIIEIECAYEISKYLELIKMKEKLRIKSKKSDYIFKKTGSYPTDFNMEEAEKLKTLYNDKLANYELEIIKMINSKRMCGIIFLIFNTVKRNFKSET